VPGREERRTIVESVAAEWRATNHHNKVAADPKALELIVENLAGLSTGDTRRLVRKAIFDDGMLSMAGLPALVEAKYRVLNRSGAVTFGHDTAVFDDVGGLTRLKQWLEDRRPVHIAYRCCGSTLARFIRSGTANRSATFGRRSPRRTRWRPACCGSMRSKKGWPQAMATAALPSACSGRPSPGLPTRRAGSS
jgi:hypothetical protein